MIKTVCKIVKFAIESRESVSNIIQLNNQNRGKQGMFEHKN